MEEDGGKYGWGCSPDTTRWVDDPVYLPKTQKISHRIGQYIPKTIGHSVQLDFRISFFSYMYQVALVNIVQSNVR